MSTDKRFKDKIKETKKYIKELKKEIETARKCEEWGSLDNLCNTLELYQGKLTDLEKLYLKQ